MNRILVFRIGVRVFGRLGGLGLGGGWFGAGEGSGEDGWEKLRRPGCFAGCGRGGEFWSRSVVFFGLGWWTQRSL